MISRSKVLVSLLTLGSLGGLLGTAAWWIRRDPTPSTAMESVVSYWEKWSEDVVRERVRSHLRTTDKPHGDLLQGAAETLGGVFAIELYERAVQQEPQCPQFRMGLVRSLCASSIETTEVMLTATSIRTRDPMEENLHRIIKELRTIQELEPDNACVDYLVAFLGLSYLEGSMPQVLADLETAKQKTRFDDYSLDAARNRAELLFATGFPRMEAQFAVLQGSANPLREVWSKLGERLEGAGQRFLLEEDLLNAERAFQHQLLLGGHLASMRGWLQENLAGLIMKRNGARGLKDVFKTLGEKDKMEALDAVETEALSLHSQHQSFQWWRGRRRLEVLTSDEFSRYLNLFLKQGAMEANTFLLLRQRIES